MEISEGGSQYERIRNNAYWHNAHLDTEFTVTKDQMEATLDHIDDCIHNPTRGLLARREKTKPIPNYPEYFRNKEIMFNFPEVKAKNDVFESQYKKMYPKTGKIRKSLIESKYVVLNTIKPKMTRFQKLIFKLFHV